MVNAILVILVLAAAPAFADQSSVAPKASARFGTQRPSQNDPYKSLFEPRAKFLQPAMQTTAAKPKPQIVCGMTMVPGDTSIDPKMARPLPADGIDYKLRTIAPPICSTSK
jgi:hypothetical protein